MPYIHKEYMKKWRAKRKAAGLSTGGKASKAWWDAYQKSPKYRAKAARLMRKYSKDPILSIRHKARRKVRTALNNGSLTKEPCFCGVLKVQAHHHDYSKPLEIKWLCLIHHRAIHAQAEAK